MSKPPKPHIMFFLTKFLKWPVKLALGILGLIIVLIAGYYGLVRLMDTSLIYSPNTPSGSRTEVKTPDASGFKTYEVIGLTASDDVKIVGYWIPEQPLKSDTKNQKHKKKENGKPKKKPTFRKGLPTVIFLHGSMGNMVKR